MDKKEHVQSSSSTGETSSANNAQSIATNDANASTNVLTNLSFLQNIQQRFDLMGGDTGGFLGEGLPPEVVRRINALRNLQVEHHRIETTFFEEVHALECRYLNKYKPLYEKRLNIIKGIYEPTDTETKCAFDEDQNDEEAKNATETQGKTDEQKKDEEKVIGVPEFWLQVLKNSDSLSDMIKEHDEPVLKHLTDVRLTMQDEAQQKGFTIEFEFSSNEYFTNTKLTKSYELRTGLDEHEPLAYEGPEIIKSKGCEIHWNKGKNVTVKTVKKRQKHKSRGTIRVVTKEVKAESFFNFFTPPTIPDDAEGEMEDSDEMRELATDFEIGHLLRDSIIPKAVLYYTGEIDDEDDGDFDEDDEDDDDDDDDDDDEDLDEDEGHGQHSHHHHHHGGGRGGHNHGGGKHGPSGGKSRGGKHDPSSGGGQQQQQPECKQQ